MSVHDNQKLTRFLQQIDAAFVDKDLSRVEEQFRKIASAIKPSPEISLTRTKVALVKGDFSNATSIIDEALRSMPGTMRRNFATRAGSLFEKCYRRELAEPYYRLAWREGGLEEGLSLVGYLAGIRKGDEAAAIAELLRSQHPDDPRVLLLWCKLHRDDSQCLFRLESLMHSNVRHVQILAHYEMARHKENLGDFRASLAHLREAKSRMSFGKASLLERRRFVRKRWMDLVNEVTPSMINAWREESLESLQNCNRLAFLIGHPRSGTTLIEQILDSSDCLDSVEESEIFTWMSFIPSVSQLVKKGWLLDGLVDVSGPSLTRARRAYTNTMAKYLGAKSSNILLDKNPSYSILLLAIYRFFPEAAFVAMIRDPRDVVISCYFQPFHPVNEVTSTYLDIGETVKEYCEVMTCLQKGKDLLGEAVYELKYEDLVSDPSIETQKLFDFLRLGWSPSVLDFHTRTKSKIVRSPTADAVTEPLHARAKQRWKNYIHMLREEFEPLEPFLEKWGY
ncbi:sulfotransferase family protein [Haloferula sargassicola]|uniref:Sulfotransferase family protein n=1 Tax=Haloferula sargassicola TaxID=490096 RepID=A0ABP9UTT1_9BACT